ncbi:MAG: hypothetical protein J6W24_02175 [Prevotella sp.]|nr:hypothetical protein [Prevotella sp.]
MKKIFTLIAVAATTLAANAQYTEFDTSALNADATTDVAAGTVMATSSNGIVAKTGFDDACKIVGVSASGYTTININGTDYSVSGGYQGNNNAKDAGGGNPASTLLPAASGSVLVLDVPTSVAEGYIYVVGKFSQNKQYVVTEDGGFIGYTIVCDGTAAGQAATALTAEVKGDDADQYFVTTPIDKLGAINGAGDGAANNGVGFIKFAAYGGSSYNVHATGSKLTQCGFYFSATGDETITISGTDVPEITLQGTSAVAGVAEAKAEVAKAVKVITAKGVQIGKFNVAGQQVK